MTDHTDDYKGPLEAFKSEGAIGFGVAEKTIPERFREEDAA